MIDQILNQGWEIIESGSAWLFKSYLTGGRLVALTIAIALVLSLVYLIVVYRGYPSQLLRGFKRTTKFIRKNGKVTADSVSDFERVCISKMPSSVQAGWGYYKKAMRGLPGDYITEYDCLQVPAVSYRKRGGVRVLCVLWALYAILVSFVLILGGARLILENGVVDVAGAQMVLFSFTFSILLVIALVAIIQVSSVAGAYDKREIVLQRKFLAWLDLLDENVEGYVAPTIATVEASETTLRLPTREEKMRDFITKVMSICADPNSTIASLKDIKSKVLSRIDSGELNEAELTAMEDLIDNINRAIIDKV